MKKFSSLLHNLILTPSRNTKIKLLQDYFKILDINRAYALAILSDQLSFQFIKASKLRELVYEQVDQHLFDYSCLLYTSPSPRDLSTSRMPSSA